DFGGDLAVSIESMGGHSCALMSDDSLRCWGWGDSGRLGYNSAHHVPSTDSPLPMNNNVNLGVGETAATVGVGSGHTCAWLVDGGLRCWGVAGSGQLGYGAPLVNVGDGIGPSIVAAGDVPLTLGAGVSVTQIAAGGDDWGGHTCVLQSDGN